MIDNFDPMSQMTYNQKREYEENAKMNKELTPLKALEKIKFYAGDTWINSIEWNIIETALKNYEEIINTGWKNIPTNLQFLDKILDKYLPNSDTLKDLEKSLKAFEIIKEKEVNVFIFLHSGDLETYNEMVENNRKLTQEEYDLIKGLLL